MKDGFLQLGLYVFPRIFRVIVCSRVGQFGLENFTELASNSRILQFPSAYSRDIFALLDPWNASSEIANHLVML